MIERTQIGDDPRREGIDRRLALGGVAALLATTGPGWPAWAQDRTVSPPQPQPSEDALALAANMLTRMAAVVRINGRGSLLFVLDTGAERTAIASDLVDALALKPGPSVMVHGVSSAQSTPTVEIERLHFGSRRFNNLRAPVFDRRLMGADGLLGLDVLSQFVLSLDLLHRRVSLAPSSPGTFSIGRGAVIPTRLPGGARTRADASGQLILTNALADGVAAESFIDSGGQYSIGNRALLQAIGSRTGSLPIPLLGVTGQTIDAYAGGLETLKIGRWDLGPTPLLFSDLHAFRALGLGDSPAMLIGADILYRFRRVDLDYGARRIGLGGLMPRMAAPA